MLIFFGSSVYSLSVLSRLLEKSIPVTAAITTPDKPIGRHLKLTPNPVKIMAKQNNIPVIESIKDLTSVAPETVGLVAAYGKIIPQRILDLFNTQIYNIHPSLLPKYRGPSPLHQQILDGITETGVTLIQLDPEMDHGPILTQQTDQLLPTDTPETLGQRLFTIGADIFINLYRNQELITNNHQLVPQDHSQATYTHLLSRQDGFLPYEKFMSDLRTMNYELRTKFLAYYPWPGIWTTNPQGQRVKLTSISPLMIQIEGQKPQAVATTGT